MKKKLRIAFLSDAQNTHTKRWVQALADRGNDILLFSIAEGDNFYDKFPNVQIVTCGMGINGSMLNKLKYFTIVPKLKKCLKEFKPDLINAHYASSYGTLGALCGFHPFVLSVWGSDIYDFPNYAPMGKSLLRYNFKRADRILSTSHVMAKETSKYTDKKIFITPFGVDTSRFKRIDGLQPQGEFIVGNVKTLSPKYGIDVLIRSFKIVVDNNPGLKTRLVIYGKGPNREEYENLAKSLGIGDIVDFRGFIVNEKLPEVYNSVSVSVSVSDSESFGVVAVEAMACECPVVTSDADGFTEVVENGVSGIIVPKRNPEATAAAIQKFIDKPDLRSSMGQKGRDRVKQLYDWEKNVDTMIKNYQDVVNPDK